jgi:hypothetical protein
VYLENPGVAYEDMLLFIIRKKNFLSRKQYVVYSVKERMFLWIVIFFITVWTLYETSPVAIQGFVYKGVCKSVGACRPFILG